MPQTVIIGAFVLGAILLLVALIGGRFKIFGAEVSGSAGPAARLTSGIVGVAILIAVGLDLNSGTSQPQMPGESKTPITISYELGKMLEGHAAVYIDGNKVGVLHVSKGRPQDSVTYALPRPGSYEYSIQAQMTIEGFDQELHSKLPLEQASDGRGTIQVEAGKRFVVTTNNLELSSGGPARVYAELLDAELQN